jgi:hypothetical protein
MRKTQLLLLFLFIFALACRPAPDEPTERIPFDGTGYRPVYASAEEVNKIETVAARELTDPGKIYVFDPYLFINEKGKGIHIIDNKDPRKPKNLSFISIPSNYDIAVKDQWLYADNLGSLLVFDISNPLTPKLAKRVENAVPVYNYPPFQNVYFECADPQKGVVVGWEKVDMSRPKCFR